QDFSQPVNYTVTAENGNPQVWTVNVVTETNGEKSIDSFVIDGVSGTFNGTDISVTLPFGTDVTALSPIIEFFGQSVNPPSGTPTDFTNNVTYTVTAEDNTTLDYTVDVTITPKPNTAPTAEDFSVIVQRDSNNNSIDLSPHINDDDDSDVLTVSIISDFRNGTATVLGNTIVYTPAPGYTGIDTIVYDVDDGNGGKVRGTVNVTVNTAPTAENFSVNVEQDSNDNSIDLLPYIKDADGDELNVSVKNNYEEGSATISGNNMLYTPNPGYSGIDSIVYTVSDGNGGEDTAIVTFTVMPAAIKKKPVVTIVAIADITLPFNSVNLTGSATDEDGTILSYAWTQDSGPSATTTITNASSSATMATDLVAGNYVFRLTATDNDTGTGSNTVAFTVIEAQNNAPLAVDDNFSVDEAGNLNRLILTNDTDDENNDLTVNWVGGSPVNVGQSIGGSDGGLFTITAGGNLTFNTNGEFDGLNNGDSQTTTVQYRVTDGNSNSNIATVTVTVTGVDDPKSSDNDITQFTLSPTSGNAILDDVNHTATITVPFGTDLLVAPTNLVVSTGASVSPLGNVERDFSNPVNYTVMAENGDSQNWQITVNVEADTRSNENDITQFTLSPTSGNAILDDVNHTATITVPFGTDLFVAPTNLVVSTGATVSPLGNVERDFSNPVNYTVTAENGDVQNWTIIVNEEVDTRSNENDITQFTLSPTSGDAVLDNVNHTATITVPFGTDLFVAPTNLVVSTGASVSPLGNVERDFSNPVNYTVMAENGDSQVWQVIVNVEADTRSNENDITQFTLSPTSGDAILDNVNHTATITVPFGTDLLVAPTNLVVSTGASVSPLGNVERDFSNPVNYTVMAENGDSQNWQITVNVEADTRNNENDITQFTLSPTSGNAILDNVNHTATITVPFGTDLFVAPTNLVVSTGATVSPLGNVERDFSNPVNYTVTAENGDVQNWTIIVNEEVDTRSNENDITQFTLSPTSGDAVLDNVNHTATITVPFGTDLFVAPTNLVVSTGASVSPLGNVERDFSNPVNYTVMAENGDSQVWQVIVNVNSPPAFVFSNGHAVGSGLSSITGTLTINSPTAFEIFAVSDAQIVVVTLSLNPGNSYSATTNHGSVESVSTPEIPIGTYTYTISILGDNGQGYVERKE
ncbi:Ig-like domain-containing protein, partial [uncultured Zobellia sp.]|uniref:beta strand repeat-containing protein n=1 Tax=uncultured Zobellia sp. TaxID=255433 RepID=UPI0025978E7D